MNAPAPEILHALCGSVQASEVRAPTDSLARQVRSGALPPAGTSLIAELLTCDSRLAIDEDVLDDARPRLFIHREAHGNFLPEL